MLGDLGIVGLGGRGALDQRQRPRRVARAVIGPAQRVRDRGIVLRQTVRPLQQRDRRDRVAAMRDLAIAEIVEDLWIVRRQRQRTGQRLARTLPVSRRVQPGGIVEPGGRMPSNRRSFIIRLYQGKAALAWSAWTSNPA